MEKQEFKQLEKELEKINIEKFNEDFKNLEKVSFLIMNYRYP